MTISTKDWLAYIGRLSALNNRAADEMRRYIARHGFVDTEGLISYAYGLATKYGEASAALSAEMYDAVAALEKAFVPAAEVAETATLSEVSQTVQGVAKQSQNPDMMANAVGRLVKRAGADTTLKNALRDGAEFAWIPAGDTCAFCLTLASRGWRRTGKKAIRGGHAEHIHANCDCTYAIRFDSSSNVEGYEPDKYLSMYEDADGATPREKINAMRREQYSENKFEINEQKRLAYKSRVEREKSSASRV